MEFLSGSEGKGFASSDLGKQLNENYFSGVSETLGDEKLASCDLFVQLEQATLTASFYS